MWAIETCDGLAVITVNGQKVPEIIRNLIEAERWKMPCEPSLLKKLFHDLDISAGYGGPTLYLPQQMEVETSNWLDLAGPDSFLRGTPDMEQLPGDIAPENTVLIGDAGMGWDSPIAMDFRISATNPRIILFAWANPPTKSRWIQIAPNLTSFIDLLGLQMPT